MGLGFTPLYAAGLSLIANTAPVAFGAIGTPILTLAAVTGIPVQAISAMAGTPPNTKIRSAPAVFMAFMVAGYQPCPFTGGVKAYTRSTPATLAGMMLIWAEPNIG